ncbi:MAG: sigma-70 family RNA polymerase sigma factor [Propionibacteriaceae bacterium]
MVVRGTTDALSAGSSAAETDEFTVVARAQDGSTRAFEMLLDRYQTPLFRYAYRLLNDRSASEDVVQETFIAAWRGLPTLSSPGAFRGWLYQIATRRVFDVLRARRPQVEWPDEDDPHPANFDVASPSQGDPAGLAVQQAQFEALHLALATLPPQQRAAWTMQRIDGLSYDEIAVALSLPVSTVRGRIARARQTLAERMASWR